MKRAVCIIQEDMFSTPEIKRIEAGFKAIYKDNYSEEPLNVVWMIMPKGYAYSERKLSEAIVIMVEVSEDIQKEKREELMFLFSRFLMDEFNVSPLDSVITVANSSFVNAFLEAQNNRIQPLYRPWIKVKQLSTALWSKFSKGYLRLRVKY